MSAGAVTLTHPAIAAGWLSHGPERLARIVGEACPGPASEPASMWLGQVGKGDGGGNPPQLWRIGTALLPGHGRPMWPVAVPLLDDSHLQITTTEATRRTGEHLVEALLMRVLSTFRPGLVRVHLWDTRQMAGALPGLYPLMDEGLFTVEHPAQLGGMLDELGARCTAVSRRTLALGHASLRDQAAADTDGARDEPWTIAVLLGDGTPPPSELYAALQRVARSGLAAGISLITVDMPVTLPGHVEEIVLDGTSNRTSLTGPRVRLVPDLPLDTRQTAAASTAIADEYRRWKVRAASFRDLLPAEHGGCDSTEGVAAPVGFTDTGAPVMAELGDATPHALIGGPSGTGKTNLILAWLMGLSARYSPDDLALYLLDFKEGVSFAPLAGGPSGERWLPHARLVGVNINEDREFGLALLRYLSAEMRRRAQAAKKVGATKLAELRRADPDGHWPRIVAVMDEVQVLVEPQHDPVTEEAVRLLEDIARRGRSQGIHLVLASQNLADVRALWARAALLEQFSLRIGTPRAQGVFATQNKALDALPRHHAIVNAEGGVEHGNVIARVPNACAAGTADEAQIELWERWGHLHARPVLLDGDHVPAAHTLWSRGDVPVATVGQAFTVHADPAVAQLTATPGRNLAVLGAGTELGARVLSCAAAGLAQQGVTVDLVTFEQLGAAHADWVDTHTPGLRQIGFNSATEYIGPYLQELHDEIRARLNGAPRPARAVAVWEVDAADTRLTDAQRAHLQFVIHHGPEVGIHVLGWWRSVNGLHRLLMGGAATAEDIGAWAVCDVIGQAIGSAIPGMVANGWEPRAGRGWLYDRHYAAAGRQLFAVPSLEVQP